MSLAGKSDRSGLSEDDRPGLEKKIGPGLRNVPIIPRRRERGPGRRFCLTADQAHFRDW